MKVLLLLICLATCVPVCLSQSNEAVKPDLTGTWQVEAPHQKGAKSQEGPPEQIKITHHDPELIIRRMVQNSDVSQERELTYYTDGRGETNTIAGLTTNTDFESWRPRETESKTIWSKDKVVTRSVEQSVSSAAIYVTKSSMNGSFHPMGRL
jgi:outer membrane lipoprotein-sorting protein